MATRELVTYCGSIAIAVTFILFLCYCPLTVGGTFGNIQIVRANKGARGFSWSTRLAYYTNCLALLNEGYQLTKDGIAVWIPGLGPRKEILVPQEDMKRLFGLPESSVNIRHAYNSINCVGRALGDDKYMLDNWQGMIVSTDLNKVLNRVVISLNEELRHVIDTQLETSPAWHEVDLLRAMHRIVVQATSRFQVGLPLCRNEAYLNRTAEVMNEFLITGFLLGMTPSCLQAFMNPFASWRLRRAIFKISRMIKPLYEARLKTLHGPPDDSEPGDYFQILLRFAKEHRPDELNLHDITNRLCLANFEAMHQTSVALTNMLLNILASDAEHNTVDELRKEAAVQLEIPSSDDKSQWTKVQISKLKKADSIARETMRMHSFMSRGLFRKVMANDVHTNGGAHLPKDSILVWPMQTAHSDPGIFDNPGTFDPWRFERLRNLAQTEHESQINTFVSTAQLLYFGRGRHACPGRWLVDFEVKMVISYVTLNFDIKFPDEYGGERPKNRWFAEAYMLPKEASMMVRRRALS